jgi:GDP-4-dehydro-6-deoxy-D-mannose reductase
MVILITGAAGFVAQHFLQYLDALQQPIAVVGLYNTTLPKQQQYANISVTYVQCNLMDANDVETIVNQYAPTHILHLAAQSSVAQSLLQPADTMIGNISYFVNICEAVRKHQLPTKILYVGSAEVYGANSNYTVMPSNENSKPNNPYGVGRKAQEDIMQMYVQHYQLNIVGTRSFNHIGPGQTTKFVIASFAQQITRQIQAGKTEIHLQVGNTTIVRDFLDVRDVVHAYYILLNNATAGEILNVCSSAGTSIQQLIDTMAQIKNVKIITQVMPDRIRPNETLSIVGNGKPLQEKYGWQPTYTLEQTLRDILDSCA